MDLPEPAVDAGAADACFAAVAIPVPLHHTFSYRIPAPLLGRVVPGARVAVPFGRRKLLGVVVAKTGEAPDGIKRIRSVVDVVDAAPLFSEELLAFLVEAARYYMHPVGEVLKAASPAINRNDLMRLKEVGFLDPGSRTKAHVETKAHVVHLTEEGRHCVQEPSGPQPKVRLGVVQRAICERLHRQGSLTMSELKEEFTALPTKIRRLEERGFVRIEEVSEADLQPQGVVEKPPELNAEQRIAVQQLEQCSGEGSGPGGGAFLLQGVTGSGKTEVYLRVIESVLERGGGALVLVPEIALTPQLVGRFRKRFGEVLAVLHSGLSGKQRFLAWQDLREGRVRLAIGARSALFAPVQNLSVIVVDEEHDPSFKQETGFRYHARDMALLRAHRAHAVAILGSATPSLESRFGVESGRLGHLRLEKRATRQGLPDVEVVDLNRHKEGPSKNPLLSAPLFRAMETCLANEEQAILFLNRRGFAPATRCATCGKLTECPACSVALTEHRHQARLRCHYCDYSEPVDKPCVDCGSRERHSLGQGTEQLEGAITAAFTGVRVARLDRDTANARSSEKILGQFRRGEVDVLVGTQMVTKGHDLPRVTLVGVILADQSMAFPDFRAGERTFQLLSQVAGRAGRGDRAGRVVVQTFQPTHAAVHYAAKHDYEGFYDSEIGFRRDLGYPPFAHLVSVRVDAGEEAESRNAARTLAARARQCPEVQSGEVVLLGPVAAPVAKVRGRFRHRMMLRCPSRGPLRGVADCLIQRIGEGLGAARASLDVDPVAML